MRTGSATVVDAGWAASLAGSRSSTRRSEAVSRCIARSSRSWRARVRPADDPRPRRVPGEEDRRYGELRARWRARGGEQLRFFVLFQAQALIAALLSLPFLAAVYNRHDGLEALEWIGLGVWLAGLVCEAQADRQLDRFRRDPSNRGAVIETACGGTPAPELLRPVADVVRLRARRPRGPVGLGRAAVAGADALPDPLRHRCSPLEGHLLASRGEAFRSYQRWTSTFVPLPPR